MRSIVFDQREHFVAFLLHLSSATQTDQLHHYDALQHFHFARLQQVVGRHQSAAGGQQIVDNHTLLVVCRIVTLHLQNVLSVLQLVRLLLDVAR